MKALEQVYEKYQTPFRYVSDMVLNAGKRDRNNFTEKDKLMILNTILPAGLLYKICQVKLVLQSENETYKALQGAFFPQEEQEDHPLPQPSWLQKICLAAQGIGCTRNR